MRLDALSRLIVGWCLILVYTLTLHNLSYLSTDVTTPEEELAPQAFFSPSL